jgi:hypothetical protein
MLNLRTLLAAACALTLAGCATNRETVYVDLSSIHPSSLQPVAELPSPKAPGATPGETLTLPATEPTSITLGARDDLLRENIERAERELSRALSREYLDEAEREASALLGALNPERDAALAAAQDRIRERFSIYAEERAPKLARLTAIVGFPDPNPASTPSTQEMPEYARRLLEEARQLRADLRSIDAAYEADVAAILQEVTSEYDNKLAELQAQIARQRSDAIERAEQNAVRQAQSAYAALQPSLLKRETVEVPGTPAKTVTIEPVQAMPEPPKVESNLLTPQEREALLKEQLTIWSSARGYVLSQTPIGARDATDEFKEWRKEMGL